MPGWLIAVLAILGVIGAFIGLIFLIRAANKKSKLKFKEVAPVEQEPEPINSQPVDFEQTPIEDEFSDVNFDEPEFKPSEGPQVEPFNPFDFDNDFDDDDELNYQNFMRRRGEAVRRRQLSPDEEFEKFRREHCYSKFVTDAELAKALRNAPKEVREVILNDLLKSLNLNDYNIKL